MRRVIPILALIAVLSLAGCDPAMFSPWGGYAQGF
jgi:hypothetical protein